MSTIFIAKNQTATPIYLNRVNVTVPASGDTTLTEFATIYEIQSDENLKSAIEDGYILISDGTVTYTKSQSLSLSTQVAARVTSADVGQNLKIPIKNGAGTTLAKGTLVASVGYDFPNRSFIVDKADKDDPDLRPSIGVIEEDLLDGYLGLAMTFGLLRNIDTSVFDFTDQLVLGNNGQLIRPYPDTIPFTGEVQYVASVARVDAVNGILFVTLAQQLENSPTPRTIVVGEQGGEFTTIEVAIAEAIALGANANEWWVIQVTPGTYIENPLTVPAGVLVRGDGDNVVVIQAADNTSDLITVNSGSLDNLTLRGATDVDVSCVRVSGAGNIAQLRNLKFRDCYNGLKVDGYAAAYLLGGDALTTSLGNQIINAAVLADGQGSTIILTTFAVIVPAVLVPFYGVNPILYGVRATNDAQIHASNLLVDMATFDTAPAGVSAEGGAHISVFSTEFKNITASALRVESTGGTLHVESALFTNNTVNFDILSSVGKIFAICNVDATKSSIVAGGLLTGILQNEDAATTHLTNEVIYEYPTGRSLQLSTSFFNILSSSLSSGGEVSDGYGLNANVTAGIGFVRRASNNDVARVSWDTATLPLVASAQNYILYNGNTQVLEAALSPPGSESILLAVIITNASGIRFLHHFHFHLGGSLVGFPASVNQYLLNTRKTIALSGLSVSAGSTGPKFEVSSGSWYIALDVVSYAGSGGDATFSSFYGADGYTENSGLTDIDIDGYDSSGTIVPLSDGYFRSDTLYLTSDGRLSVIYGTTQYLQQVVAEEADTVFAPSFIRPTGIALAKLVVEEGTGIVSFIDIRPTGTGGGGGGGGGTSNHSLLSNLDADDHLQYLLANGGRAMTGTLNVGGNDITNVGSVDGVDISSHAARHNPGGIDALTTTAPVTIGAANVEGSAASFARSDHIHAHGSLGGGSTHAAVTTSINGYMIASDKVKLDSVSVNAVTLTSGSPVDVTKSAALVGTDGYAARADHKHDISTAAPSIGIGAGNSEGTSISLARADHNHTLRTGSTDLTIGTIGDGYIVRRSGTTLVGNAGRIYPASATDPVSPAPDAGDMYYNTTLNMLMAYDSTRGKWLSTNTSTIIAGRNGTTNQNTFYRNFDGLVQSSTLGWLALFNGTVVAFGYTRSDVDLATFEIHASGSSIASLASTAISGKTTTLNANFTADQVLAVKNQSGGSNADDVHAWAMIKWRV